MFHPERLTGKRRRKYLASINYAPQWPKIPKHLLKVIRAPAHHVKYVTHIMPDILGARVAHHVAVIRNRVVALNHDAKTKAGEVAVAGLTDANFIETRCRCYAICEMYGTHTSRQRVWRKNRYFARAEIKPDLKEDMIKVRLLCRKPAAAWYRGLHVGHGFDEHPGDTHRAPAAPHKELDEKFDAAGLKRRIQARAAEVLAAAVRGVQVTAVDSTQRGGDTYLTVRQGALSSRWTLFLDSYAWYSRIYHRGLAVLGDWFITHAGRWNDGPTTGTKTAQQTAVDLLVREFDKTPEDLGVCQPAAAVSLTWLRRPCPFVAGREIDTVAGVIARPFPGVTYFLPYPNAGSSEWKPGHGSHSYVYKLKTDYALPKPVDLAAARAESELYLATIPQLDGIVFSNAFDHIEIEE